MSGKNGPFVVQLVGLVPKSGHGNATVLRHNMAESALGTDRKRKLV